MRATLLVLAMVLAAGVLGLADDGSVPWPTSPAGDEVQEKLEPLDNAQPLAIGCYWKLIYVVYGDWIFMRYYPDCAWTWRCLFSGFYGLFDAYEYQRTNILYYAWCCESPFWPEVCDYWNLRVETVTQTRTTWAFIRCGCP